jgi:transcriptional regulator with XRE-family HTH domain
MGVIHHGEVLKKLRMIKGYSQVGIAIKIKTKQQYVSKLESKEKVKEVTLKKVLVALDSTTSEFEKIISILYPPPSRKQMSNDFFTF